MRKIVIISSFIGSAAVLIFASHPGRNMFDGAALLAFFVAALGVNVVAMLATIHRRYRRDAIFIAGTMLALVISGAGATTLWPLRARVAASEPWLRPYATGVLVQRVQSPRYPGVDVGLFNFQAVFARDHAAILSVGPFGLFGEAGLYFDPVRPKTSWRSGGFAYDHLYGPWWRMRYHGD